jgi:uncharacterized MAPEG superfamily protein
MACGRSLAVLLRQTSAATDVAADTVQSSALRPNHRPLDSRHRCQGRNLMYDVKHQQRNIRTSASNAAETIAVILAGEEGSAIACARIMWMTIRAKVPTRAIEPSPAGRARGSAMIRRGCQAS